MQRPTYWPGVGPIARSHRPAPGSPQLAHAARLAEPQGRSNGGWLTVEPWFDHLTSAPTGPGRPLEIDYRTYGEGEALLGWLNGTLRVDAGREFDGNAWLRDFAAALQGRLAERGAEVAHLKMTLSPDGGFREIGLVNLVGQEFVPEVGEELPSPLSAGELVVNLRAEAPLELLAEIQPASGGFLEAVPLTSFVTMSLASLPAEDAGPVIDRCVGFLARSVRGDGSWPIDVDLATWVTTLSVNALPSALFGESERRLLADWLLGQQHVRVHPFTGADPGGWAWTDLPGGVPDADDTAGALLALARLAPEDPRARAAAELGVGWLLGLANRDGGIPTFCRGWGKLPFDRSAPDLTGHALRAWHAWRGRLPASTERRLERAARRAAAYLARSQRTDGSWVPLWFGNQAAPGRENPTYGTSRVVLALAVTGHAAEACRRGARWLLGAQNADGGWGGAPGVASSTEETALAVEALGAVRRSAGSSEIEEAAKRGVLHLLDRIDAGDLDRPAPIGLYFADLWYSERLYPVIFTAAALGRW